MHVWSSRAVVRSPSGPKAAPPKFNEKTLKRRKKERKLWREREKKKRENLGSLSFGPPTLGFPPCGVPFFWVSGPHPSGLHCSRFAPPLGPHLQGQTKFTLSPLPPSRIIIIIVIILIIAIIFFKLSFLLQQFSIQLWSKIFFNRIVIFIYYGFKKWPLVTYPSLT